ncbi:hypothetical protein ES703_00776 [subsurface metagenome]
MSSATKRRRGRPPRALKVARELRDTGAFVLLAGILVAFAGGSVLSWLDRLELTQAGRGMLEIMAVLFLIAGLGCVGLGVKVIRKAMKIVRFLKG